MPLLSRRWITYTVSPIAAAAALAAAASPASAAATSGQLVSGTTLSTLSLTAGAAAAFTTNFGPGNTPTTSSILTATDTSGSWNLSVQDQGAGGGKMVAGTTGCTGSDAELANPLDVTVTSVLTGVTSAGQVAIGGTSTQVASATAAPLAATVFTASYSQTIPSTEAMVGGCVYSLTATYTLQ